jgi:AhpD family alkylhydroperoxidase
VHAILEMIQKPVAFASPALCDLVTLVVSQDNSCRYCYGTQRAILRIHGYRDEYVDALLGDFNVGDLSPADRAALELVRRLTRANPLPGRAEFEEVVDAGSGRQATAEIAAVAALSNFSNRLATLIALPPDPIERFVRGPLFRVMRPLIAWKMRPRAKRPEPVPEPNDGLFAPIITALGGSPYARVFRGVIDDAFASDILPRRTKLLAIAVVARAIGCVPVEREAGQALAAEGLAPDQLDDVLRTLGGPSLDAREARLVPFARETVRYEPAGIQRRFRDVSRDMTPAEILEAGGAVALGNAICRLSIVLDA